MNANKNKNTASTAGTLLNGLVLVAGMILLLLEVSTLKHTVGATRLVIAGIVAGLVLYAALTPLRRRALLRQDEQFAATLLLLAGLAGGATATFSHLNHALGREAAAESLPVLGKQFTERTSKAAARWSVQLQYRGQGKWIDIPPADWAQLEPGQAYATRVIDGALGLPVLACPAGCR